MIPWMREKFAERRARWIAARNKRTSNDAAKEEEGLPTTRSPSRNNRLTRTSRQESNDSPDYFRSRISSHSTTSIEYTALNNTTANTGTDKLTDAESQITNLKTIRRQQSNNNLSSSQETVLGRTKEKIKVRIICPSARVLIFQTDVNKRIAELKNEIILELSDDTASMPLFATDIRLLSPRYRIVKADFQSVELIESWSLAQYHVEENDTLALILRRNNLQQAHLQSRDTAAPREQDIEKATRHITAESENVPMVDINEIFQQSNLQFDVRKVLISLAQASAAVIGSGPYANRLIAMLKQKLINKRNYRNDTLQCLIDMGFGKEKAEYALKLHNSVYSSALEWLIQRQSDAIPLETDAGALAMQKSQSIMSPSGILTNDSVVENTQALREIVRIYSHRYIPPTPETVTALTEMGFMEKDVLNALKKTCNNKAAACEWLCGNRSGSLVELRDGLAPDSPILKTILELPQVQINLSNPKILLAFLSILENEQSIRVWGGDSDTTSVITQILQKYHEEKHVMGINQFYGNR